MIRIKIKNDEISQFLTRLYGFPSDNITIRIAFCYSLQMNKKFDLSAGFHLTSDGKDFTNTNNLYGGKNANDNFVIYQAMLDQHYGRTLSEEEFSRLFRLHLDYGLEKWNNDLLDKNITGGYHISYLMRMVKNGLELINETNPFIPSSNEFTDLKSYENLIEICLGRDEKNLEVKLRINDLNEFDSCNIAIAGMVGSGKTELVKDLLYQISAQTKNELKFIFFDYKGEGNPDRLKAFFEGTGSKMVDLKKEPMGLNPLSFINLNDRRTQEFNIKSFVDFVCTIATQLGARQKHILQTVIIDCFDHQESVESIFSENYRNSHPTLADIFEDLQMYYDSNGITPDTLYSIISDLATNIFSTNSKNDAKKIYEESLYINLPIELSDTLRQLCVFLTLKYLLAEFSSTNDTEPTEERIKPLRYVIVVDEAHVYLKNKNASKALEDILRVLRSKGVVIIMLTQGVEDYKTKNFDFSSQIKIPICLNINNKDYKLIESFVGTPRSKQKLLEAIGKLEPQKGIINIIEPQVVKINQFWKTLSDNKE
jgi:DNA sulfur modification protein DndE